jgi:exopolysaccharide biosynthesis polyprenyl glycosylphosphotransferase
MVTLSLVALGSVLGLVDANALSTAAVVITTASVVVLGRRAVRRTARAPRALIVGEPSGVHALADLWTAEGTVDVIATCPVGAPVQGASPGAAQLVPRVSRMVAQLHVDTVIVVPGQHVLPADLNRLAWALERHGVHLGVVDATQQLAPHRTRPGSLGNRLVIEIEPSRRPFFVRTTKFVADRLGAALLLVLAAPLLAVLCLLVRLDSRGPAIFRQQRIGRDGRPFTMFKLRTMHVDAERMRFPLQREHPTDMLFKLRHDPRITRIGKRLRRSSLDELPQLFNVLRGDMSLIGPRPALPEEVARYDETARRRLAVPPGLTGLWQVSGRSDLSWQQSLALDLSYVDNWRLTDDLGILARTAKAVLTSRGAY